MIKVQPYSLPLSPQAFHHAIECGLGRAQLHVARFGARGIESEILDACLHNLAFDPQCEGDRSKWLLQLVTVAGVESQVASEVVKALHSASDGADYWDTMQLCSLAKEFARRGNEEAHAALYAAFRREPGTLNLIAGEEIVELDGTDGLLFAAQRIGEWLADDDDLWLGDELVEQFDETHGSATAERVLAAAAANDKRVERFLQHIAEFRSEDKCEEERISDLEDGLTATDLIRLIESDAPANRDVSFRRWGRKASEENRKIVMERMFAESDGGRLQKYLQVFSSNGLPSFDERLLALAKHESEDVRWLAVRRIAKQTDDRIRSFAVERISRGCIEDGEIELLANNFQPGDAAFILEHLQIPASRVLCHAILQTVLDVFEVNGENESTEPMMLVYEHSPCSLCRERAVKVLASRAQAPGWVLDECQHDASEDIRRMVSTT